MTTAITSSSLIALVLAKKSQPIKLFGYSMYFFMNIGKILKYVIPLSISGILTSFVVQLYSYLITIFCANASIGSYRVTFNFSILMDP